MVLELLLKSKNRHILNMFQDGANKIGDIGSKRRDNSRLFGPGGS